MGRGGKLEFALDSARLENGLAAVVLFAIGLIAPAVCAQNTVQTIAGGGPNNLTALASSLGNPVAVALDGAGNSFVVDSYSNRVLRIDASGNVTVAAGNGVPGYSGDGGAATSAELNYPNGLAVDGSGDLFIAEYWNCTVRKVSVSTGNISTVAGTAGVCKYGGDGGPATSAELYWPVGITLDSSSNLFIADAGNCVVREVSASTGNISTVAGTPGSCSYYGSYGGDGGPATSAKLESPYSVAVDSSGNFFIADTFNCLIRKVNASNQVISTVAGSYGSGPNCGYSGDGGPATSAVLNEPFGVTVDSSGNLFIADTDNCAIREVNASTGGISTIAGGVTDNSGFHVCGYSGDGGAATGAALNSPNGVTIDSIGNLLIADTSNSVIREVSASTGNVATIAGASALDPYYDPENFNYRVGFLSYSGDGHPGIQAELSYTYASSIATDSAGDVFIGDRFNRAVRKISTSSGIITTVAGDGVLGDSGDGGPAASALLAIPYGVTIDSFGNLFIADYYNCTVREVNASTGDISTVAGSSGNCNYFGDGGPATSAGMFEPYGIAVDGSGNIFIADWYNCTIREVFASTGDIFTVVSNPAFECGYYGDGGPASEALLYSPYGLAVDGSGNLFIADVTNCVIREVLASTGNIYTVAGTAPGTILADYNCGYSGDGSTATSAKLNAPYGMAVDSAGDLFIADTHNCVIREVVPTPGPGPFTGTIYTVAGNGSCGYSGDGGPPLSATFAFPSAIAFDSSGDLIVLDEFRVRLAQGLLKQQAVPSPSPLSFPTKPLRVSNTLAEMITNPGIVDTTVSTVSITGTNAADFIAPSVTDACAGNSIPAHGGSCSIKVTFTPSVIGTESANLAITGTTGTQAVILTGAGIDFAIAAAPSGSTSATVTQGGTANYSLQVVASGGASASDQVSVTINCSGLPPGAACTVPSVPIVATVSTASTFSVSISSAAPSMIQPVRGPEIATRLPLLAFVALMLVGFWFSVRMRGSATRSRGRSTRLAFAATMLLAAILVRCGGQGSSGPPPPAGGTPVGTYIIKLTATAGNDTHIVDLTLTVNTAQ
jgi:trimeric autotransporter adhesin